MTNAEKYAGNTHNHYVHERMCPKCCCIICGRVTIADNIPIGRRVELKEDEVDG